MRGLIRKWMFHHGNLLGNVLFLEDIDDIPGTIHLEYLIYSNVWKEQDSHTLTQIGDSWFLTLN